MKQKRVLVVDDSAIYRKLILDSIRGLGDIECAMAANGKIALEKAVGFEPDLVLLDSEMPGLNGLETLVRLRRILPEVRVVLLTSATDPVSLPALRALSLGAAECLRKPVAQGSGPMALEALRAHLVPRVEALLGIAPRKDAGSAADALPRTGKRYFVSRLKRADQAVQADQAAVNAIRPIAV
jgi:two-component system, chemotaxis family, protein-glutamate methylesterase/glutaminase